MTVKNTWILGCLEANQFKFYVSKNCWILGYLDASQMFQAVYQLKIYDFQKHLDTWKPINSNSMFLKTVGYLDAF